MPNFAKYLVSKSLFSERKYEEIEDWLQCFAKKQVTYRQVATHVPAIYAQGFQGIHETDIVQKAKSFSEEVMKHLLYSYTLPLVRLMKQYGDTIGISGAPIEVVRCLAKYFDMNLCYGTTLEIHQGVYTGRLKQNLVIQESKDMIIEKIIDENNIDLKNSFGFGDTEQDISFLSKVEYPIIINPNNELLSIAQQKEWIILNEKDDIINRIKSLIK